MKLTILGAGAWGTSLGLLASRNAHEVTIYGHDPERLATIAASRVNERALPGVTLPADWRYEPKLENAICEAELVVIAVPSRVFRGTATALAGSRATVVSVTKGIEFETGLTMSGILDQVAPGVRSAALSGPSLAAEVARGIPTAVVAASHSEEIARDAQAAFHQAAFRVYTSTDLIGVEMGGAIKNVMAIAAGVSDGLRFGDNAKAALITRGMAEMRRLGVACGARPETFAGLSGLGDLTVTCFSRLSRNRGFGERIGKGETVADALAVGQPLVEGVPTTRSAHDLAEKRGISAPIIGQVYAMLYEGKNLRQAVLDLLSRDSKAED